MNLPFEYALSIPYLILDWPKQKILQGDELKIKMQDANLAPLFIDRQLGLQITPHGILIKTDYYSSLHNCLNHFQFLFQLLKKKLIQLSLAPIAISAHPEITSIQRPCFSLRHNFLWRDYELREEISQRFFAYAPAISTLTTSGWLKNFDVISNTPSLLSFKCNDDNIWEINSEFFDTATGVHEFRSYFHAILELLLRTDLNKKDNEQNARIRMANNYNFHFRNEFNTLLLNDFFKNIPATHGPTRLLYDRWLMQRNPALEIKERFINSDKSLHPLYWEKCILTVA